MPSSSAGAKSLGGSVGLPAGFAQDSIDFDLGVWADATNDARRVAARAVQGEGGQESEGAVGLVLV